MAAVLEHEAPANGGWYQRWSIDSGDSVTLDFRASGTGAPSTSQRIHEPNSWSWLVSPTGTVVLSFTLRPDFTSSTTFATHGQFTDGEIDEITGNTETDRIAGFRFAATAGSDNIIEFVTPGKVTVETA